MNENAARLRMKTRNFTVLVILSSLFGNFFLSWGLHRAGLLVSSSPLTYVRTLFNPWVALGVILLIIWVFAHMALLSWADLSYVLPVTSIGYVLTAFAGRLFLHESISNWRWGGIILITAGVALVARTSPHKRVAGEVTP